MQLSLHIQNSTKYEVFDLILAFGWNGFLHVKVGCARILYEFQPVYASIDIENETFRIIGRCIWQRKPILTVLFSLLKLCYFSLLCVLEFGGSRIHKIKLADMPHVELPSMITPMSLISFCPNFVNKKYMPHCS